MSGVRGEGAWDGLHHLSLWHPQVTSGGRLRPFVAAPHKPAAAPAALAAQLRSRSRRCRSGAPAAFASKFIYVVLCFPHTEHFFFFRPSPKSLPTAPSLHVTPAGLEPRVLEPTTNITLRSALRPSQKVAARRLISLRRERFRVYLKFPPVCNAELSKKRPHIIA